MKMRSFRKCDILLILIIVLLKSLCKEKVLNTWTISIENTYITFSNPGRIYFYCCIYKACLNVSFFVILWIFLVTFIHLTTRRMINKMKVLSEYCEVVASLRLNSCKKMTLKAKKTFNGHLTM